ncbi:MAG: hypothetical protein JNL42_21780 [Anaerolineae bacterium]|nr:hypothetical protein [Anaerolineae bacterium]
MRLSSLSRAIPGLLAGVLMVGCVAQPDAPIPTLANLPTETPVTAVGEAVATASPTVETPATDLPSPTISPTSQFWFAAAEPLIYVYDCPSLTCGRIATFASGEVVEVVSFEDNWAQVRLPDGFFAFVLASDLQENALAGPSSTASASPTPTPSPTPTMTQTASRTPSPTPSVTGTRFTPTYTWTFGAPFTAVPTLPVVGRSVIGGVIGIPGGTENPDGVILPTAVQPTSIGRQPPGVPTLTPSHTPSPTLTSSPVVPFGTSTLPPTVPGVPTTVVTQPFSTPPAAGSPLPTSAPPGSSTPPPGVIATPTSGPPPGQISTPPGA